MATCSKEGVPNASYLSHVYQVDDRHVATSFQFFNKTRSNLLENPYATIQVRYPSNNQPYRLRVKYIRSEDSGPVFDEMNVKLDVIASYEGMGSTFKLRAVDIYEVLEIEKIEGRTRLQSGPCEERPEVKDLELMRVLSDKLARADRLEELFDQALSSLNLYLGWSHMILLLAGDKEKTLLTHASFGYSRGGVGSEVKIGEGLIGLCAQHRRLYQLSALQESVRYAQAVKQSASGDELKTVIPLPGLERPASQMAAPIVCHGELLGVLALESEVKSYWEERDMLFLSLAANLLGLGLSALLGKDKTMSSSSAETPPTPSEKIWRVRFCEGDDLIFINDQYLIKNVPAQILNYLLVTYLKTGRTEFSNKELRAEKSIQLPEFKDNLETRLILLRKRLIEQNCGIHLVSTGRGKFKIEILGRVVMSS